MATIVGAATGSAGTNTIAWSDLNGTAGVVVLMRHAIAPGGGDPPEFRLGDCATQRNLSSQGRGQATRIGDIVRRSSVDVDTVISSPWCRTSETADLLGLGSVQTRSFLGSTFTAPRTVADRRESQAMRFLKSRRADPGVVIAVTHYANILDLTGVATQSGEALAVRVDDNGVLKVLGRLPAP